MKYYSKDFKDKFKHYWKENDYLTYKELANKFKIPYGTVYKWISDFENNINIRNYDKYLNTDLYQKVIKEWNNKEINNLTNKKICKKYNIKFPTLVYWIKDVKYKGQNQKYRGIRFKYSDEIKNQIYLYAQNHSLNQTAKKFNIARASIYNWKIRKET